MILPEELWVGVDLKAQHADFYLSEMGRSLQPPERTQMNVALMSSGVILDTRWQRSFYAYFDAFLAMARSIPEIINCCFGKDTRNKEMTAWFRRALEQDEQDRRQAFTREFEAGGYKDFRQHPLATARNISFHRAGYASSVEVTLTGLFGVMYVGSPIASIPTIETRSLPEGDPHYWLMQPSPIPPPRWSDFTFDGKPLFEECRSYLALAQRLIEQARSIVQSVHGRNGLSAPP